MPKKVQTPIDSLKWLSLAAEQGKYVTRNILTYAYASEEHEQTVTSDGYRLHIVNTVLPNANERGLIELPKSVEVSEYQSYVNYRNALDKHYESTITVYAHEFRKAIQLALTVTETDNGIWLVFSRRELGRSNVAVIGKGDDGAVSTTVECSFSSSGADTYQMIMNGQFLLDALRGLYIRDDDLVTLDILSLGEYFTVQLKNADTSRFAVIQSMSSRREVPDIVSPDTTLDCPAEIIETRCAPRRYPHRPTGNTGNLSENARLLRSLPDYLRERDNYSPVGYEEIIGNRSTCRYGSIYWNFATEHHFAYEHARADRIRQMACAASAANTGKFKYPWLKE